MQSRRSDSSISCLKELVEQATSSLRSIVAWPPAVSHASGLTNSPTNEILLARLHIAYGGQTSDGRWRLSSSVVVTLHNGAYATKLTREQHATAGQ